jgi:hypothetical protein
LVRAKIIHAGQTPPPLTKIWLHAAANAFYGGAHVCQLKNNLGSYMIENFFNNPNIESRRHIIKTAQHNQNDSKDL